jgi:peptide/nickel transport system permease protein
VAVLIGLSLPVFVIGEVLILVAFVPLNQHGITWIQTGYAGITQGIGTWVGHMILPWITLAAVQAAVYTRLTRGQLLDVMGEDYIRTARSKGLSEHRVIYKHGVRAALTPVVSQLGVDVGQLLGGVIVVETVFGLGGLGETSVQPIYTDNLPLIIGFVVLAATFVVVANIVVDVLYAVLDPRVRIA